MLEAVVILCSKYQNQRLHYEAGAPPGCMAHLLRQCMTMKTLFTMCGVYGIRHVNGNKFQQRPCWKVVPCIYGKVLRHSSRNFLHCTERFLTFPPEKFP